MNTMFSLALIVSAAMVFSSHKSQAQGTTAISPIIVEQSKAFREFGQSLRAFRQKYKNTPLPAPALLEAQSLLQAEPKLSVEYVSYIQSLAKKEVTKANVDLFLAELAEYSANSLAGTFDKNEIFKSAMVASPITVKALWKKLLSKQLEGPIYPSTFLSVYAIASAMQKSQLAILPPTMKTGFKSVNKYIQGNVSSSLSIATLVEKISSVKNRQKKLSEELALEPELKAAVKDLLAQN